MNTATNRLAELSKNAPSSVSAVLDDWQARNKAARLWDRDPSIWTNQGEEKWLGWLDLVAEQRRSLDLFREIADDAKGGGFTAAVVLGMGGSSLCPEVLRKTFGVIEGFPELFVLDSTVPSQVSALARRLDLARTLFIVSSKSGSTIEPNVFMAYFLERVKQAVGAEEAGSRFLAITDPGSHLEQFAREHKFRRICPGVPSVGGRYSALSNFGMVPAAVMGLDVAKLLERASLMVEACGKDVPPAANSGIVLGAILGTQALHGRDKVTIIASPKIDDLGAWLEQLIAESTGKLGKGLIPVAEETLGPPQVYGDDRLFAYIRLHSDPSAEQDAAVDALEASGRHVVRAPIDSVEDLGQAFFEWEIATAVAGSVVQINPFDQPDVEAAKVVARELTKAYEETGKLPDERPTLQDGRLMIFLDEPNHKAIAARAASKTPASFLQAHLGRIQPGDYFAINAYVEMNEANGKELQAIRHAVRDVKRVATTLGYGPRFLHSTGQLHKGGPSNGVFLQITSDDAEDVPIPGQKFTFGVLKRCQAQGDLKVLEDRGRRVLRVHLGKDVAAGLASLRTLVEKALG